MHGDGRDIGDAINSLIDNEFADLAGVMTASNADINAAPAMLASSELPVGGMGLIDGKILRRDMDDEHGNAQVNEVTAETLWKDQAAEWQAFAEAATELRDLSQKALLPMPTTLRY